MVVDISATEFGVKGLILEETEISRALFELYEGAIVSWTTLCCFCIVHPSQFLHQGKTYIVSLYQNLAS